MSRIFDSSICTVCKGLCMFDTILCELCNTWFHRKCVKMTQKQFKKLSNSSEPFFCAMCVNDITPFSKLNNYQLSCHLNLKPLKNDKPCLKCNKPTKRGNRNYCISNKHYFHTSCNLKKPSNTESSSTWCCSSCLNFPFNNLDTTDFLLENLSQSKNPKHLFNVSLSNRLTIFNKQLPTLSIPDPLETDNNLMNFNYYSISDTHKLFHSLSDSSMFSVIHTNIRSYNKNFSEFNAILTNFSRDFDIIGLSETWDTHSSPTKLQQLDGYHPPETTRGETQNGGVLMYIKDHISFNKRNDLIGKLTNSESLFIEIERTEENIIAGVIYRHPNTAAHDFVADLKPILETLLREKKQIILMGDFNLDLLKVNDHKASEQFLDSMLDYNLMPYICQPTRFDKDMKSTLIDNNFLNQISSDLIKTVSKKEFKRQRKLWITNQILSKINKKMHRKTGDPEKYQEY